MSVAGTGLWARSIGRSQSPCCGWVFRDGHGYNAQAATWGNHVFSGATLVDGQTRVRDFTLPWLAEDLRWKDKVPKERLIENVSPATELRGVQLFDSMQRLFPQVTIRLPQRPRASPMHQQIGTLHGNCAAVARRTPKKLAAQRAAGTQVVPCYQ